MPLVSPVGETISDGILAAAARGNGSLVPFPRKGYAVKRKKKVLAIHVAKGNTNIDERKKDCDRFYAAVAKIKAGGCKKRTN